MKRLITISLGLLLWSAIWAPPSHAHALLVRSQPAANTSLAQPPTSIEMWFSEPLEETFTSARLLSSAGEELETGRPIVDPTDATHLSLPVGQLEPGFYTVAWQTLSQVDGHEWIGSFPFTVLNPDGSSPTGGPAAVRDGERGELPTPADTAARWLTLTGGMLLFGVALFRRIVAAPGKDGKALIQDADTPALRLLWLAILLMVAGDWTQLLLQTVRLGGLDQLPDLLLGTRVVRLALARQLLASTAFLIVLTMPQPWPLCHRERRLFFAVAIYPAILILLLWLGREQDASNLVFLVLLLIAAVMSLVGWFSQNDSNRDRSRTWVAIILAAAAALYTLSTSSHAGAVPGSAWAVLGDYVHLLAAATWLGGLVLLALLLWRDRRADDDQVAARRIQLVRRFSFLASFSVFVLIFTGLFNSLVELPTLESLWSTAYGRVLFLKLLLVELALIVAFFNNFVVHRSRNRWSAGEQIRRLKRLVAVEVSVAALLVISVAVLVQTPAPRGLAEQQPLRPQLPFNTITIADDLYIHTQVSPNQIGNNRFWLHLYHQAGDDIGDVQLVRLLFDYQEEELGQASADLAPLGQNTFAVEGTYLNQPGVWEISAYVRRRGMDDVLATFTLEVPEVVSAGQGQDPWQNPIPTIPAAVTIGVMLAAIGLIPILWRRPLRSRTQRRFPLLQIGGILLVAAGSLVVVLAVAGPLGGDEAGDAFLARTNPIEVTETSIEQGRSLYEQNCLQCHGPTGEGDGPVGLALLPHPANLQVHMVPGVHSDDQIFEWISNGMPDTPMPAFGDALTETERWHLINYIRTLVPEE
jgi:copper transport protein